MIKLYNGVEIPEIGAGTYPFKEELPGLVRQLTDIGYRMFDTSDNYHNEEWLGKGLQSVDSIIPDDITVISKYSNPAKSVKKAFEESCKKINKLDIYLLHWPYPHLWELRWKEMEELYISGMCKAVGVCNFNEEKLDKLLSICRIKPMINQFECHPMFQQRRLIEKCKNENIQVISYSPLARINKELFESELLKKISISHGKSVGQIILKWNISEGRIPIPASGNAIHMKENYLLDDFELSQNEIDDINSLERGLRIRFDPDKRFSPVYKLCFFGFAQYLRLISAFR